MHQKEHTYKSRHGPRRSARPSMHTKSLEYLNTTVQNLVQSVVQMSLVLVDNKTIIWHKIMQSLGIIQCIHNSALFHLYLNSVDFMHVYVQIGAEAMHKWNNAWLCMHRIIPKLCMILSHIKVLLSVRGIRTKLSTKYSAIMKIYFRCMHGLRMEIGAWGSSVCCKHSAETDERLSSA